MNGRLSPCMGGWCTLRDRCPNYHAAAPNRHPSERLCLPGADGISDVQVIQVLPVMREIRGATLNRSSAT